MTRFDEYPVQDQNASSTPALPWAVVVGDFNGDGKLDLAVANSGANYVSFLMGDGRAHFSLPYTYGHHFFNPHALAIGDFDRNGTLDVAVAYQNSNRVTRLSGDGKGNFENDLPLIGILNPPAPSSIAVGDLNHDGVLDIVVGDASGIEVSLNTVLTTGVLLPGVQRTYIPLPFPTAVALGDLNRDGNLDIVAANNDNTVSVLLGHGDGTFASPINIPLAGHPVAIAIGDINRDGIPDLAVAAYPVGFSVDSDRQWRRDLSTRHGGHTCSP